MKNCARHALMSAGIAFATIAAGTAQATTYNFGFSGTCSEACSATAAITPGAGTLTIVLTNSQADPRSAGDLLSGIEIGLGGTATLGSQSGALITVASNTGPYATTGGPPTHWGAGSSGGNIFLETAGSFAVGGAPINMIIGPPNGSGNYANGNSSVADGHFSPYINGTGTFVINNSIITSSTDLTHTTVALLFGTTPDYTKTASFLGTGNESQTPIPGALPLFASGGGLLGFLRWRRSRKQVANA